MDGLQAVSPITEDNARLIGKVGIGALALFVANATLLLLYLVYDLTLFQLVIVFWLECFWVGFFSALKIIAASLLGDPYGNRYVDVSPGAGLVISLLTIGFVSAEFLGLFAMFAIVGIAIAFAAEAVTDTSMDNMVFDSIGLMFGSAALFFVGHGISFIANFIGMREYKTAKVGALLALPFRRCLALLGAIIIAFAITLLVPDFSNTTSFAILLLALKVFWDFRLHLSERRALK
jgi:hypothetical protein